MKKIIFQFILILVITVNSLYCITPITSGSESLKEPMQDTLVENQILYNGREWFNLYYMVEGDQFLFSDAFLPGSIIVRGKSFRDISIKYDIFEDEILIPNINGGILQVNKEMVDSFNISYQNKLYLFTVMPEDRTLGYVNILYQGKTSLYVKYNKKIEKLAIEGKYDNFYLLTKTYFVKDSIIYNLTNKRDLLKVLADNKDVIKSFMKKNKIKIIKKNPESFIPVIRFFENLEQ
jgi:hypothetical protein